MRRIIAIVLVLMLFGVAFAEGVFADMRKTDDIAQRISEAIHDIGYYPESITVNVNMGTDKNGDFIALITMVYRDDIQKNNYTYKDEITLKSERVAEIIAEGFPEINELVIFWEVENSPIRSGKITYLVSNGKYEYEYPPIYP